jgi:hypothetical protein
VTVRKLDSPRFTDRFRRVRLSTLQRRVGLSQNGEPPHSHAAYVESSDHCGSPRWLGRRRDGGDAENSDGGALAGEGENAVVSD